MSFPLEIEKQTLMATLENANYERDQAISELTNFKEQFASLQIEYQTLKDKFTEQCNLSKKHYDIKSLAEKKLKENMLEIISISKKLSQNENKINSLYHENDLLRNQLSHFKSSFNDMDKRKSDEIATLEEHLSQMRIENEHLKNITSQYEDKLNDLTTKYNIMKKEKDIAKRDNDHLMQIIENSNLTVKTAEEKSKSFDDTIKLYKQKIYELELEILKYKNKIQYMKDQRDKQSEEYQKILKEKNDMFDDKISEIKEKFMKIVDEKIEDINFLKGDFISMKIERDKYYSEYNILQKEIERLNSVIKEENEKNMQKEYDNGENMKKMQNEYIDKIQGLEKRNEVLEKENVELSKMVSEYREKEKADNELYEKLGKNEEEKNKEIANIKRRKEELEKENMRLKETIQRKEQENQAMKDINEIQMKSVDKILAYRRMKNKDRKSIISVMTLQKETIDKMDDELKDLKTNSNNTNKSGIKPSEESEMEEKEKEDEKKEEVNDEF